MLLFESAARLVTVTYPLSVYHVDFGAYPFAAVRTSFFMAEPGKFHDKGAVFRAGGIAVNVIPDFFKSAFIPWGVIDERFGEAEFIFKETVSAEEGIGAEIRVQCNEIRKCRL